LSAAAPAVSAPTAAPPRKAAKIAVVAALLVAAAFLAIGAVTAGGRFLYRAPQQQPPQMPQRMAGTLNEFPVDTAPVATRPTAVVSQSFKGNEAARQVKNTQKSLPPGISTAVLPKIANSVTSATYKSRPEDPPVNVHVLDTRTSGQAQLDELAKDIQVAAGPDAAITGVRAQSPSGAQYGGYRVRTPTSDAYVLAKAGADILVTIFSPESTGRETAARLAANLGNGAGLMDDPEVRGMVCALPAMLPAGLELDQVSTANLSQMPEQITGSLAQFGAEGQKWAEQIRRFVPQRLTTSVYRGPDNQRIEVLVGDYGGATSAWTSWTMLRWILRPWSSTNVDVHGTSGLNINAEGKRFVLFQRGPFLVVLQGDAASAGNNLLPLANSLQI